MQEYNVNHITSSLHYPQSNALTYKFVQTVKNLSYKAEDEGTDLFKFDDMLQNPNNKQPMIPNADLTKQDCQITAAYVKCS